VLGYTLPHCPFVAPKPLFDYYCDRVDIPLFREGVPERSDGSEATGRSMSRYPKNVSE